MDEQRDYTGQNGEEQAGEDLNEKEQKGLAGDSPRNGKLSRRNFLRGAGAAVVAASSGGALASCNTPEPVTYGGSVPPEDPTIIRRPPVWSGPIEPTAVGGADTTFYYCAPEGGMRPLEFFRPHEARTVEAITARILPGSPEDPGAREAGVVFYIDCLLATGYGDDEPTYRQPPYAMPYDEDDPPSPEEMDAVYGVIWVPKDELERYGYQTVMTPREEYRMGLVALDRYANQEFDDNFVELSEDQQDQIVEAMANDEAEGFDEPAAGDFFETLRDHTIQGMFSDPIYGGNRNMVGWRLVGYPGAQRGYSPQEMLVEGHNREPQSLQNLHHYHPGHTDEQNAIFPVRGSGH
jgi:gluconate 2-dehydrogenase gamma chain